MVLMNRLTALFLSPPPPPRNRDTQQRTAPAPQRTVPCSDIRLSKSRHDGPIVRNTSQEEEDIHSLLFNNPHEVATNIQTFPPTEQEKNKTTKNIISSSHAAFTS
eukprot:gene10075-7045_t